jgi:nucleoside-diphosphate-sugar epimerase
MKYLKRILLTGASGTVGKEVLRQLCESTDENEITVFDLETKLSKSLFRKYRGRINVVYGDLADKNDVIKVCRYKDIVIHLAAIIPPLADKQPGLAKAVNVDGTGNLIRAVEEFSPGAFFLYSSSISVYGDRCRDPFIKADDLLNPSDRDEYARTKIEAEKIVRESHLKWSIFRLTAIMGINNHKPSEIMFHMPLESKMEIATPGDTGRAFIKAIDHIDELSGKIFNLSGGEKCRIDYRDFLSRSFEIFGLGKLDFRENSFAGRNFHCGYYKDGDILNDILDFRRETIEDYFETLKKNVSLLQKIPTIIFRRIIKLNLQKKSEPLAAVHSNNEQEIKHFFR